MTLKRALIALVVFIACDLLLGQLSPTPEQSRWIFEPFVNFRSAEKSLPRADLGKAAYLFGGDPAADVAPALIESVKTTSNQTVLDYTDKNYNFAHQLMRLSVLLMKGHRPEKVIFIDGDSQIRNAFMSLDPDASPQTDLTEFLLKRASAPPLTFVGESARAILSQHSGTIKLLERYRLIEPFRWPHHYVKPLTERNGSRAFAGLSTRVFESYLGNLKYIDGLAKAYNFVPAYIWVPQTLSCSGSSPELSKFAAETNAQMATVKHTNYSYASGAMMQIEQSESFKRSCEISPLGRQILAEALVKLLSSPD